MTIKSSLLFFFFIFVNAVCMEVPVTGYNDLPLELRKHIISYGISPSVTAKELLINKAGAAAVLSAWDLFKRRQSIKTELKCTNNDHKGIVDSLTEHDDCDIIKLLSEAQKNGDTPLTFALFGKQDNQIIKKIITLHIPSGQPTPITCKDFKNYIIKNTLLNKDFFDDKQRVEVITDQLISFYKSVGYDGMSTLLVYRDESSELINYGKTCWAFWPRD